MATFRGFPAELIEFYEGLEADNSKSYWLDHKEIYDVAIAAPMAALAEALTPEFGKPKVFRPYRDVRFSPDKRPYKKQASLVVGLEDGGALYFQVSAESMFIAGGFYQPGKDQLLRWRELQYEPPVVADLDRTLATTTDAGFPLSFDGALKTAPRGWSRDHERIEFLRLTSMTVSRSYEPAAWWDSPKVLTRVVEGWRTVQVWTTGSPATSAPPPRSGVVREPADRL